MKKLIQIVLVLLLGIGLFSGPVMADQTMDQIEKTGKIKLGFREGSIPFAFVDPKVGKHVGFSVDMASELANYLGMRFGKKIEIVPHTVTPKTRIPMVVNGTVDVEMGSTTYTQKREEQADFSMVFFFSETTFLVAKDSGIQKLQDLNTRDIEAATRIIEGTANSMGLEVVEGPVPIMDTEEEEEDEQVESE